MLGSIKWRNCNQQLLPITHATTHATIFSREAAPSQRTACDAHTFRKVTTIHPSVSKVRTLNGQVLDDPSDVFPSVRATAARSTGDSTPAIQHRPVPHPKQARHLRLLFSYMRAPRIGPYRTSTPFQFFRSKASRKYRKGLRFPHGNKRLFPILAKHKFETGQRRFLNLVYAGTENRTRVYTLEVCHSATKPCPQFVKYNRNRNPPQLRGV